ncbi:DUF2559 family protein [Pantoea deleyi]|uniref:DUF2559 family protein n=1 Tax=Pantoea deleyi TaxID=470932 RepID=A0A506QAV5_9GAMM|nr:YhfG family protein [Pantoea deleyi]TPV42937.1 DUF2559 family protein [Pantoea deleyi]
MKKTARASTSKKAEAIFEATKVANFAASSRLEGIYISADSKLLTLEEIRRRYKQ